MLRVDYNLEYENLEKFYLKFILISNFSATSISKKNDGNLKFNLESDNLEKAVGNLLLTPTIPVVSVNCMTC